MCDDVFPLRTKNNLNVLMCLLRYEVDMHMAKNVVPYVCVCFVMSAVEIEGIQCLFFAFGSLFKHLFSWNCKMVAFGALLPPWIVSSGSQHTGWRPPWAKEVREEILQSLPWIMKVPLPLQQAEMKVVVYSTNRMLEGKDYLRLAGTSIGYKRMSEIWDSIAVFDMLLNCSGMAGWPTGKWPRVDLQRKHVVWWANRKGSNLLVANTLAMSWQEHRTLEARANLGMTLEEAICFVPTADGYEVRCTRLPNATLVPQKRSHAVMRGGVGSASS